MWDEAPQIEAERQWLRKHGHKLGVEPPEPPSDGPGDEESLETTPDTPWEYVEPPEPSEAQAPVAEADEAFDASELRRIIERLVRSANRG